MRRDSGSLRVARPRCSRAHVGQGHFGDRRSVRDTCSTGITAGVTQRAMAVTSFTIRRAGIGDESTLRRLRLEALTDAPEAFGSTYSRELARTTADWQRWFSPGVTFILDADDGARGLIAGVRDPERMLDPRRRMVRPAQAEPEWKPLRQKTANGVPFPEYLTKRKSIGRSRSRPRWRRSASKPLHTVAFSVVPSCSARMCFCPYESTPSASTIT